MQGFISRRWPLVAAVAVLWITVAVLAILSIKQNGGNLVYALDDAYIHMAMAKNFVQHGVWGITRHGFTSASSSVLWTLLLAAVYYLFGVNEIAPLILNIIFATLLLCAAYAILARHKTPLPPVYIFLTLLGITFITPVPTLIFSGMEHTLHTVLTVLFIYFSANLLSDNSSPLPASDTAVLLLPPFLVAARYEGLFLVFAVSLLLMIRKRWIYAIGMGLLSIIPVGIYGIISVKNGWYCLPNSILLKGHTPNPTVLKGLVKILGYTAYEQISANPHVLSLIALIIVLYIYRLISQKGFWGSGQLMAVIFLAGTLLHMNFAKTGWLFRYEAYLMACGLLVTAVLLSEIPPHGTQSKFIAITAMAAAAILCVKPFAERAVNGAVQTPQAMNDRYVEHIHLARFVAQYYDNSTIMVNDIGVLSFYTNVRILDIFGLGSMEPAVFRKRFTKPDTLAWARRMSAKVAILKTEWSDITPRIPDEWDKVGKWRVPRNVVFEDNTTEFFAIDPSEKAALAAHLRQFAPKLPNVVEQTL